MANVQNALRSLVQESQCPMEDLQALVVGRALQISQVKDWKWTL